MKPSAIVSLVCACVVVVAACGGRTGFDSTDNGPYTPGGAGGNAGNNNNLDGGGTGGSRPEAGLEASNDVEVDVRPDVLPDVPSDVPSDVRPDIPTPPPPDGSPGCVGCLTGQCGEQIGACFNDAACVSGSMCVVNDCLSGGGGGGGGGGGSGGGPDIMCILGCFSGNWGAAQTALSALSCASQTCGEQCGIDFGGGGGGGGGGSSFHGAQTPSGWFGFDDRRSLTSRRRYIGSIRVPYPSEVADAYPWFADVLAGRMPDPVPPCIEQKRAQQR